MNFIFDFDGTIADSLRIGVKIVNKLLREENKMPISKNDVRSRGTHYIIKTRTEISKYIGQLRSFDSLPETIKQLSRQNKKSFGFLFSFRPKSPWQRDKSMCGAARRPANSGIGANLRNCSNLFPRKLLSFRGIKLVLFYQKLLTNYSSRLH